MGGKWEFVDIGEYILAKITLESHLHHGGVR